MSSIIQTARKSSGAARAASIMKGAGYKSGGGVDSDEKQDEKMISKGVHEHEAHLHKGESKTKLKFKSGGHVHGKHAKARGDHKSRTKINIIVGAGQAEKQAAAQQGMQQGIKMGAMAAAPKPPMAPPPAPPPMPPRPPMAGPPGGPMKKGGRLRRADGGSIRPKPKPSNLKDPMAGMDPVERNNYRNLMYSPKNWSAADSKYLATNPVGRLAPDPDAKKSGGMVKRAAGGRMAIPHLKGGSGGGQGRIAKAVDYGAGSVSVKAHLRKAPHQRGGRAG